MAARFGFAEASTPFVSDGGHYILDCSLAAIPDPERLSANLSPIPGVVETGLFIGLARTAIVARAEGVELLGEAGGDNKVPRKELSS